MSSYQSIHLVKRPVTSIEASCFESQQHAVQALQEGQFRVKQTHMSLDPAMRGWMSDDRDSYIPPVELGEVMRASGIAEVVESLNPSFPVGSSVMGMFGWTEQAISNGAGVNIVPPGLPAEAVLAVLALPGMTAAQGLLEIGKPKAGETLLVSGAAGSVGSLVGQIAKAEGLRVIGVAGSDEKCAWLVDELGFDGAVNYKTDNIAAKVAELTPNGVDIYFENTGGAIQQVAVDNMNAHGRIVVCGMIADYNTETPSAGPNWIAIVKKRLSIQGFTMPDHFDKAPQLMQQVGAYLQAGKLQYRVHVLDGLESAIEGINLLFSGQNQGKLIVKL
ncbi:NADP-dependent oxidoreductase [Agarivorans sp. 1_MG-2023]|uniref:NADP-dependent oxidoreductase n=1 Tax=Agarivorans sp. 1_MG-2023 TaxID=3062634 RepID=UPI0026E3AB31|nr:NADP-dependent oxidoreductase [Agarivorans sp. 1_MG-2023]MDO6764358.1 NADP-dependent oxidoreductase [Agarivorans sp. 1_MG-2023]